VHNLCLAKNAQGAGGDQHAEREEVQNKVYTRLRTAKGEGEEGYQLRRGDEVRT
jgi:hypothetical protein